MESNKSPLTKVGFKIENIICNQKSSIFKFWFWSLLPVGDKLALDWTRFEKASSYNKTTYLSTTPAKKNYLSIYQSYNKTIYHSYNKTTYLSTTPKTKQTKNLPMYLPLLQQNYLSTTPTTKLPIDLPLLQQNYLTSAYLPLL